MWLGGDIDRAAWYGHRFKQDMVLEAAVRDDSGHTQGTILIQVMTPVALETSGHFVDCRFLAASDKHYQWWATLGPGKSLKGKALYHFCESRSDLCGARYGRKKVIHVEKFRVITPKEVQNKSPNWAFSKSLRPEVDPVFNKMLALEANAVPSQDLPWLQPRATQATGPEGSESSSETEEDEDITSRVKALKAELEEAERIAVKQKEKLRKLKAASAKGDPRRLPKDKPKPKKEKKRKASKSPEKVKSKEKRKRAKSARGSSEEEEKRKKKKKRAKKSSSGDAEEAPVTPLFGGGKRSESEDSGGEVHKKKDRGPFGRGAAEGFGDEAEEESDEAKTVFRDAPTQSKSTNQLQLVEYSQKFPGRLAARLLRKMAKESSLGSVGAMILKKSSTPPAALHYLQTVLLPGMHGKMNVRTSRELRTLCTVLDCLSKHQPAKGADIIGQRIKALERSTAEGHWGSAQFLELISPDSQSLLDRAEEVYVSREFLLEQKVKQYESRPPRQGKGDQKGGKGKGPKGGDKKGKDKPEGGPKS